MLEAQHGSRPVGACREIQETKHVQPPEDDHKVGDLRKDVTSV